MPLNVVFNHCGLVLGGAFGGAEPTTRRLPGGVRGATLLAKEDPAAAATNADNYEYFVESLRR